MTTYENKKIKEYANEMPYELRQAISALNDDIRLAVFFVLFKYGELSFSQIMDELEMQPQYSSKLTYHIKKLQKGALIKNEYAKKNDMDSYSFYDITIFGEEILNNLINTITISQPYSNTTLIPTKSSMETDSTPKSKMFSKSKTDISNVSNENLSDYDKSTKAYYRQPVHIITNTGISPVPNIPSATWWTK